MKKSEMNELIYLKKNKGEEEEEKYKRILVFFWFFSAIKHIEYTINKI